jgi:holo-ACP synthase/triphosphoribosyl-dephospho-CoA synthase
MYNMDLREMLGKKEISLQDMLDAREKRVSEQKKILSEYNMTLISFTLNIPGSFKQFPLAEKTFEEGKRLICSHLKRHNMNTEFAKDNSSRTGYEIFYAVNSESSCIKRLMVDIEDSCMVGRIFDIDVLNSQGEKISRADIEKEGRSCLLCDEFAHVCSRSKVHNKEELTKKTVEIMQDYFCEKFANICSSCACKALMYEVMTTPKPGLVDRNNNGSHKDMDIYTFIDSSSVLTAHFRDFVLAGIKFYKDEPEKLFERVRYLGMKAEEDMFKATSNINTHKGLIFSLGIICTALGYLYANNKNWDTKSILDMSKNMTVSVLNDFENVTMENAKTYGERLFANFGINGIRGEATNGFSSVKEYGLPVLTDLIKKGFSLNDAGAITLLNLIANVKDTNIISRSNIQTQELVQNNIKSLLNQKNLENILTEDIVNLDKQFIDMNISPGGCADLLAITYMLYFIEEYI